MKLLLLLLPLALSGQMLMPIVGGGSAAAVGYKTASNARQFSGTAQYLKSSATVDLSSTKILSISFFLWWDTFGSDDHLAMETSANYNSNTGAIIVDPNAGTIFNFSMRWAAAQFLSCSIVRPSAAAWHHYLLILDNSSGAGTCTAYVDGSAVTATHTANGDGTTAFGNYTLNVFSRNGASLLGAGRISEIAFWKSVLTSGNASSLATYTAASSVDATNLLFYWPIKGASPEVPTTGTPNLNITGATAVSGPNP